MMETLDSVIYRGRDRSQKNGLRVRDTKINSCFFSSEDWTDSLESNIRRYRRQYGRTYHSYKEGSECFLRL